MKLLGARPFVLLAAAIVHEQSVALAQDASAPEEVEITVGADGTSVVREVRSAQLVAGESSLRVFDVSPQLLPETIALRALSSPELLELKQQTAWFEVLDPARALERLAGRPASLVRYHESGIERIEGRLLFPPVVPGPNGDVTLPLYVEEPQGKIRLLEGAELELDALPPGDWNRFRLDWRIGCRRADRYRLELVYLTRGLAWRADYLLRVAADLATADFSALATIENSLGVAWRGARIAVAEADEVVPWRRRAEAAERQSALMHPVVEGAALEAHGASQFSLAQARDLKVRVVPSLLVERAAAGERVPIVRRFDLEDGAARGLVRALPAGTARVVLLDAKNRPFLAATHPFAATAADEVVSFFGDAIPGLTASFAVQSADRVVARGAVKLWNERDLKVDVEVLFRLDVAESIGSSSFPVDRSMAGFARFTVPVLARSGATLQFDVVRP